MKLLVKPIDEVYRFMDETASSVVKAKVLAEVYSSEEDPVFAIPEAGAEQTNNAAVKNAAGDGSADAGIGAGSWKAVDDGADCDDDVG